MRHAPLLLALAGLCSAAGPLRADDAANDVAAAARKVFKQHCHGCHYGVGSDGGEFDVLDQASLLKARDSENDQPLIVAKEPDKSRIMEMISRGAMPPKGVTERPQIVDAEAIRDWIKAGAPPFPEVKDRPFISVVAQLTAIRDDLRKADAEDRPFLRYFTLAHVASNPAIPDEDLRTHRAALSKAINSLSWKNRIVLPRAIDKAEVIYAIDVRDLDWDRQNLWQEIVKAYPYGLKYRNHPNPELHRLDEEVHQLAGCDLALVAADWFVSEATRPPLYYTLLDIPTTAGVLERRLNVDVQDNFMRDKLSRAGVSPSGVSSQNRLLEVHESLYGSYWKSYDFKADSPRIELKRFPLGPGFPQNPFANQAFVHDGGEIIFHLPNGLQGYMLVDGNDRRIEAGPIDVVGDAQRIAGTNEIVNGVSCIACHKHGMIGFKDIIRENSAVGGGALAKVKRLYPDKTKMQLWVDRDKERFMTALEKTIGKFVRVGPDVNKPLTEFAEPVAEVARFYRLTALDLRMVACELGVENPQDVINEIGLKRLRELGLGPLLNDGKLDRKVWQGGSFHSLMQDIANELGAVPWKQL